METLCNLEARFTRYFNLKKTSLKKYKQVHPFLPRGKESHQNSLVATSATHTVHHLTGGDESNIYKEYHLISDFE